ncbi:MAG: PSP1 domain-containing protein [Eubacteriales bacterium]
MRLCFLCALVKGAATADDDAKNEENKKKEKEAFSICRKIAEHGLEMKLVEAEYTFDNSNPLYFTADGRVDFRNSL